MKKVLGCIRRADEEFSLIREGDSVAVGVSGGKDSLLLLYALALYRRFCTRRFTLSAITLDMGFENFDVTGVRALCERLDVPYAVVETDIAKVVFDLRREPNPCALCANLRRGALHNAAIKAGCNVVALGHHREDALETLLMSVFFEGRFHTILPKRHMTRKHIDLIRPMIYLPEADVISAAKRFALPVVHNPCPANGKTKREEMKQLLKQLTVQMPSAKDKLLHALRSVDQVELWDACLRGAATTKRKDGEN